MLIYRNKNMNTEVIRPTVPSYWEMELTLINDKLTTDRATYEELKE
jgi:hypothetical protein